MASTDFDFALTRNEIIESAYRKIGVLGQGEGPLNGDLHDAGVKALNLIIKDMQTDNHIYLWTEEWIKQAVTSSSAYYGFLSTSPVIFVEKAFVRDDNGDDTPLEMLTWAQYCEIQDKDDDGEPTHFACNFKENRFYLWPVPDQAYDVYYLGVKRLKDWDEAAGNGDLPVRFQRALAYQLAADLGDDFGVNTDKFEAKANTLLGRAKRSDKEATSVTRTKGAFSVK